MQNYVRKLRNEIGITRVELSDRSGVNIRTIDDWENERKPPQNVYLMKKVADVLGCRIEDLINWDSDSK